jgi:hypothetical protein
MKSSAYDNVFADVMVGEVCSAAPEPGLIAMSLNSIIHIGRSFKTVVPMPVSNPPFE